MTEVIFQPGELLEPWLDLQLSYKVRVAPNNCEAERYEIWARNRIHAAVRELEKFDLKIEAHLVCAYIVRELLLPPAWNDEATRARWYSFLLPVIEKELLKL